MEAIERKEEQINLRKRVRMSEIVRLFWKDLEISICHKTNYARI